MRIWIALTTAATAVISAAPFSDQIFWAFSHKRAMALPTALQKLRNIVRRLCDFAVLLSRLNIGVVDNGFGVNAGNLFANGAARQP
jgi:hypothetical protein